MKIIKEIEKCEQCEYFDHTGMISAIGAEPRCSLAKRIIPSNKEIECKPGQIQPTIGIPQWCPLKDYEGITKNQLYQIVRKIIDFSDKHNFALTLLNAIEEDDEELIKSIIDLANDEKSLELLNHKIDS